MFTILGTWSQSYEIQYDSSCEKNKSAHLRRKRQQFLFCAYSFFWSISGKTANKNHYFFMALVFLLNAFFYEICLIFIIIGRPWLCLLRKIVCIRGLGHRCRSELRMPCLLASWNDQRWIHHGFPIAVQQTYSGKKMKK